MNSVQMNDQQLLDEILAVMRYVRMRAPKDFLAALSVLLGLALLIMSIVGLSLQDETAKSVVLNLASEVFGAWLTVVLIDGLWRRLQTGSLAEYEVMVRELEKYRNIPFTDQERQAWSLVVTLYRKIEAEERSRDVVGLLRALYTSHRKVQQLEAQGNRVLDRFAQRVKASVQEQRSSLPQESGFSAELAALRVEITKLQEMLQQRTQPAP